MPKCAASILWIQRKGRSRFVISVVVRLFDPFFQPFVKLLVPRYIYLLQLYLFKLYLKLLLIHSVAQYQEAGENGLFEDEDTRQFYESLPDLKAIIPGVRCPLSWI